MRGAYAKEEKRCSACARQARPSGEVALKVALRPAPASSRRTASVGGGSSSPTRSGHSTTQADCALKYSLKPESSHSAWSLIR